MPERYKVTFAFRYTGEASKYNANVEKHYDTQYLAGIHAAEAVRSHSAWAAIIEDTEASSDATRWFMPVIEGKYVVPATCEDVIKALS